MAVTLAACGAYGGSAGGGGGATSGNATVVTKRVNGFGSVLADAAGLALYTNEQDKGGMPTCNGACATVWRPVTVAKGPSPTSASGITGLGTVTRPNGTRQLTLDAKPLYTFSFDKPGKVGGDNISDSFNGKAFRWHVVRASGGSGAGSSGSGSSGASSAPARGSYGY